jgi:hypothetical protein
VIARILAGASALGVLAAIGVADADEPYALPAVGAQLTYRLVSTASLTEKSLSFTTGQVYTYTVTAVNGPVAEATITPVAVIYGCIASDTGKDCAFAAKAAGATRDGDLVTVPVPENIARGLAKSGSLKTQYFLTEERRFPMPGAKNPDDPNDAEFGVEPIFVLTNKLVCDYDKLKDFFPLGKTPQAALPCHNVFSRTQARVGNTQDQKSDEAVSLEFTYDGPAKISLASNDWDVKKVALKYVPSDASLPSARTDFEIPAKLGLAVRVHMSAEIPASHLISESTSELIAYKP